GNLVAKGSKWYGVTNDGGSNDAGVIFEWDQSTNVYTKKADLNLVNGSKPFASMELCNGKFYGTCGEGGNNNEGVLFEWDPSSNIYTKKIDLSWENGRKAYGSMVLHNGKLYGMTYEGGDNGGGVIYEYDPAGNTFLKKYSFNAPTGFRPTGEMVLVNGKFYGVTYKGGSNNAGVIFEWDPVTSIYTKKYDMVAANGSLPAGSLSLANGKLYGQTSAGGTGNWGVIFQWDPVTNVYAKKYDFTSSIDGNRPYSTMVYNSGKFYGTTKYGGANFLGVLFQWDPVNNVYVKKKDLSGTTNGSFPGVMSDVVKMAAPVAKGFINSCTILPAVTINNSNNNTWVPVIDNNGDAVAEIKANGNNLGLVTASMYNNTGNVREDGFKRLYLDRNITLTPTLQPTSPIEVRLYIRNSEYLAMKNSTNSVGQSSNINNISDLGVFRNADSCSATVVRTISPLTSVAAVWESDHVIATTTGSLGSFYFFSMVQGGPLAATSLEFNGRLVNNNGELNWRTRDEVNIASFELERSTNGTVYTKITNSKPTNEPGVHYYDHTDNDLLSLGSSTIYYRLRQNDLDGKFIYSRVIRFEQKPVSVITLYPNPVITEAFVSMSTNKNGNVEVRLIDNTGRVMQKMRWALSVGNNLVKFDVSALASGVYYIDMKGENINERKRFVKQ
ncbi:MAG: choice-of-anchor tandem repeat GloVer-containing protein, partial [Ferruginibacter sp.]